MKTNKNKQQWQKIVGLGGLTLIILLALILPNSGLFQASLRQSGELRGSAATCQRIEAITLPQSPLEANTPAVIALNVTPENFSGAFTYAAGSGSFNDENGNTGSYIRSSSRKVGYSGGEDGTTVTIQAAGEENSGCLVTIPVVDTSGITCESLKIFTDPDPLPENQSAAITVIPVPGNFKGTYFFQAESGQFQIQDADVGATGNQTKTLVTKSTNVLYNGGKSGETIVVKVLGENNDGCMATIPITK